MHFYNISTTMINYPGHFAVQVSTQGCNLRCGYCYNTHLMPNIPTEIHEIELLDYVKKHPTRHIVFTGGEPLLHPNLDKIIEIL